MLSFLSNSIILLILLVIFFSRAVWPLSNLIVQFFSVSSTVSVFAF